MSARAALDAIECEHGASSDWWRDGDATWNAPARVAALVSAAAE